MFDFQLLPFDFSSTDATFLALSNAAKDTVCGALSFTVRKSEAPSVVAEMERRGFKVQLA